MTTFLKCLLVFGSFFSISAQAETASLKNLDASLCVEVKREVNSSLCSNGKTYAALTLSCKVASIGYWGTSWKTVESHAGCSSTDVDLKSCLLRNQAGDKEMEVCAKEDTDRWEQAAYERAVQSSDYDEEAEGEKEIGWYECAGGFWHGCKAKDRY